MKIVITPRPFQSKGQAIIKHMEEEGFHVVYNKKDHRFTTEELINHISDADALITGNDDLSAEVLRKAPHLKVIAKYGVGLDNIDCAYCEQQGIEVCKAVGANAISVAEMTIQLLLAASRQSYTLYHNSKQQVDVRVMGHEVYGKTLGIIGYGAIGVQVAKVAHALGMLIQVYDPYIKEDSLPSYITSESFDTVVSTSDYITLHLPLLDSTRYLIDENAFHMMKSSAVVVNTARGGLIDEHALYEALKSKKIAFAAEDVELKERFKELIDLENYIIVPHAASFTHEADEHTIRISSEHVLRVLKKGK